MKLRPFQLETWVFLIFLAAGIHFGEINAWAQPPAPQATEALSSEEMAVIAALEDRRIQAIDRVIGSVVAVYDEDRQGGGSGVLIHPSGIALTNHHVIVGAGVKGWGGLADGNLYRWELVGTDPGGDVAIIQLHGKDDFPFSVLGDSNNVRVGDWALAMGNPFILTEDQKPTITLGIVSGTKRYQPGAGANQLVYGNCIQVDSSINPGNSGGPLFNLSGEVIGINGRGSFKDRGRVNVGLGYAISSNQIKNFIPDLLATKLVEHGTLDASFSDRGSKVVCSTINQDSPIAQMGLKLGDELLEFEGVPIKSANQYTNLVCTLPEGWPARLTVKNASGDTQTYVVRMFGLPYSRPKSKPKLPPPGKEPPDSEKEKQIRRAQEMYELLAAAPGVIRDRERNQRFALQVMKDWHGSNVKQDAESVSPLFLGGKIKDSQNANVGTQEMWLQNDGRFLVRVRMGPSETSYQYDGESFWVRSGAEEPRQLTRVQAKLNPHLLQAIGVLSSSGISILDGMGDVILDGGDKSGGSPAYRFKYLDDEIDWFYVWLNLYDGDGQPGPVLSKLGPDEDCDQNEGAIRFGRWREKGKWKIPRECHQVFGLSETVRLTYTFEQVLMVDPDAIPSFAPSH